MGVGWSYSNTTADYTRGDAATGKRTISKLEPGHVLVFVDYLVGRVLERNLIDSCSHGYAHFHDEMVGEVSSF